MGEESDLRFVRSASRLWVEAVVEGRTEELGCENKLGMEGGGQLCSSVLKSRSKLFLHLATSFPPQQPVHGARKEDLTQHSSPSLQAGTSGGPGKRMGTPWGQQ